MRLEKRIALFKLSLSLLSIFITYFPQAFLQVKTSRVFGRKLSLSRRNINMDYQKFKDID